MTFAINVKKKLRIFTKAINKAIVYFFDNIFLHKVELTKNIHIDYEQALSLRGMVYLKNITMIDFSVNKEFINTLRFLWLIVSHTRTHFG